MSSTTTQNYKIYRNDSRGVIDVDPTIPEEVLRAFAEKAREEYETAQAAVRIAEANLDTARKRLAERQQVANRFEAALDILEGVGDRGLRGRIRAPELVEVDLGDRRQARPVTASVREAAAALDGAAARLRSEVAAAVEAGELVSRVAAAAGVTRQTVYRWVEQERKPDRG